MAVPVPLNRELRAALIVLKTTRNDAEAADRIIHSERDIGMSAGAVQYMREEFLLDALNDYQIEPDEPTRTIPNPKRRASPLFGAHPAVARASRRVFISTALDPDVTEI